EDGVVDARVLPHQFLEHEMARDGEKEQPQQPQAHHDLAIRQYDPPLRPVGGVGGGRHRCHAPSLRSRGSRMAITRSEASRNPTPSAPRITRMPITAGTSLLIRALKNWVAMPSKSISDSTITIPARIVGTVRNEAATVGAMALRAM